MKPRDIKELEHEIGHRFHNRAQLEQALTHSSYARELDSLNGDGSEATHTADNEQMEFLGDAVLSLVTSQTLFQHYPHFREGQLSKLRSHLVSAGHLIRPAKKLKIGRFLRLGRGEEKSGGRSKVALQVDALEAVLAALYLDGGLEEPRKFILEQIIEPELKRLKKTVAQGLPITDYKSALQEALHVVSRPQPEYVLVKEEGPEHCKTFTVEVRIGQNHGKPEYVGHGTGTTKKKAEQNAAREAFDYLGALSVSQTKPAHSKHRSTAN
jgi:ribonuclease-3